MATKFYARDVGVQIKLAVQGTTDLTGGTAVIKFQRPEGDVVTRAASVSGRTLTYTTTASDFTQAGPLLAQGYITLSGGAVAGHTGVATFTVKSTLS